MPGCCKGCSDPWHLKFPRNKLPGLQALDSAAGPQEDAQLMLPSSRWVPPGEQDPLGDISNRSQDPTSDIPSMRLPHCWVPRSSWELLWYRCLALSSSRRWRQDPTAPCSSFLQPPPPPRPSHPRPQRPKSIRGLRC